MTRNALHRGTKQFFLTGLAAVLCAFATSGAIAGPPDDAPRKIVRFADLDLSKQAGVEVLYRRITGAARIVCAGTHPMLRTHKTRIRCYQKAVADAVAQVNSPLLTVLHTKRTTRLATE